ncbi:hypothetical protein BCUN_1905 [Bifidobacterium cuniculi]|uniref:Uncharacterized protein n=1 Tax=Bifidobacterium cuniculi TaxID=1688 RepID=A0A087APP2_9BIFI|nr:hypothetical protein [Bifidobacterium cuniculi]KFI60742.1 hypothetical protein BCUN_1905 [Bifidobacterium cuniculi]
MNAYERVRTRDYRVGLAAWYQAPAIPSVPPSIALMNRAGTPATTVRGATSLVTTAPAPTAASSPDGHAGQHGGVRADPHVPADAHWLWQDVMPPCRVEGMVERGDHHVVADLRPVADEDAALVLEFAPAVEEYVLAEVDVAAEIRVEGRREPYAAVDGGAGQLGEELAQLGRRVPTGVDRGADAARVGTGVRHACKESGPHDEALAGVKVRDDVGERLAVLVVLSQNGSRLT